MAKSRVCVACSPHLGTQWDIDAVAFAEMNSSPSEEPLSLVTLECGDTFHESCLKRFVQSSHAFLRFSTTPLWLWCVQMFWVKAAVLLFGLSILTGCLIAEECLPIASLVNFRRLLEAKLEKSHMTNMKCPCCGSEISEKSAAQALSSIYVSRVHNLQNLEVLGGYCCSLMLFWVPVEVDLQWFLLQLDFSPLFCPTMLGCLCGAWCFYCFFFFWCWCRGNDVVALRSARRRRQ